MCIRKSKVNKVVTLINVMFYSLKTKLRVTRVIYETIPVKKINNINKKEPST